MTAASPIASVTRSSETLAVILLGLLVVLAALAAARRRPALPARAAAAAVVALYAVRFAAGLDFVPGMVAAAPLAAVGLVHGWGTRRGRMVVGAAVAALPLVWAFQFQGGAGPQWGGRYILPTGFILTVAGVVALPQLVRWARVELVALSIGVTILGLAWLSVRSHTEADAAAAVARLPEPVVVSRVAYLARELGAAYGDKRWLTALSDADVDEAGAVLRQAGVDRFTTLVVSPAGPPKPVAGYAAGQVSEVRFLPGVRLVATAYAATP